MRSSPFVLGLLLLGALAGAVRAAPRDPVSEARGLCDQAEALRRQGRLSEALAHYRRAYLLVPTPVILLAEARLYHNLGRPAAGRAALRQIDPEVLPPTLQREHAALQRQLAGQAPPAPAARGAHPEVARGVRTEAVAARPGGPAPVGSGLGPAPLLSARPDLAPARPRIAAPLFLTLGVAGTAILVTGAALWAVDGRGSCGLSPDRAECPRVYDTAAIGIGLVIGGAAASAVGFALFGRELRARERRPVLALRSP